MVKTKKTLTGADFLEWEKMGNAPDAETENPHWGRVDIFAAAKSIYGLCPFDISACADSI